MISVDGRERVEAAISLEVADRPPFGLWGHSYIEEWSASKLANTTIDRQRRFAWDFVKFQPRASCFAEAFGSRYRPSGNRLERPALITPAIRDIGDWPAIPQANAQDGPLAEQVESIGIVALELSPSVPVIQTVFSPLTVAGHMTGEGSIALDHFRKDPALAQTALRRISAVLIDFSRRSIDAGAAGIFFAVSGYARGDTMTEAEYRELALLHDLEVLSSVSDLAWFNVVHLCEDNLHFGLSREFPCQAISWSINDPGNPTLEQGVELSGRAAMGGVDQKTTLVEGPPEAIEEEVLAARAARGGRGILVAPGCSVPPDAPNGHLAALSSAALRL